MVLNRIRNSETALNSDSLKDSHVVGTFTLAEDTNENTTDKDSRKASLNAWLMKINDFKSESIDAMLAVGALIVQEIREDIFKTLGYHCSAGIANNKV